MVFDNLNVQSGMDATGVTTDMLTLNTTVEVFYRNPATFFGVHVTVTPIEIYYFQLKLASGHVSVMNRSICQLHWAFRVLYDLVKKEPLFCNSQLHMLFMWHDLQKVLIKWRDYGVSHLIIWVVDGLKTKNIFLIFFAYNPYKITLAELLHIKHPKFSMI